MSQVEHLFDDGEEEVKEVKPVPKRQSMKADEIPSFMKATKSFEMALKKPEEEPEPVHRGKPRPSSVMEALNHGETPSFMKPTKSFEHHHLEEEEKHPEAETHVERKPVHHHKELSTHHREPPHYHPHKDRLKSTKSIDRQTDSPTNSTHSTEDKRPKKKIESDDGGSHDNESVNGQDGHVTETSSNEPADHTDGKAGGEKAKKKSVGGFLKKKFGLNKGMRMKQLTASLRKAQALIN